MNPAAEQLLLCNGKLCGGEFINTELFGTYNGKPRNQCKKCRNYSERIRKNKPENKEKERERHKKYKQENKEKERERYKKYAEKNKIKIKEKRKIYREENKDKILSKAKEKLNNQDTYLKYLIVQLRAKDKKKNRQCNIDFEYVQELIEKQNNKCIYSGAEMIWKGGAGIYQGTIDRIDSSKGHIKGNCQLVTIPLNHFKNELSDEKFRELISLIIKQKQEVNNQSPLIVIDKKKVSTMFNDMKKREILRLKKEFLPLELIIEDPQIDFDKEYFYELVNKNNNRCTLTGVPLSWETRKITTGSIDRIDSSVGYRKDNIQLTLWYVNCLKKDMNNETCLKLIDEIVRYNTSKVE